MDRRSDRLEAIEKELKKIRWLKYERLAATDGKAEDVAPNMVSTTWDPTSHLFIDEEGEQTMTPGARGKAASHYRAWEIAATKEKPTLILEERSGAESTIWIASPTKLPKISLQTVTRDLAKKWFSVGVEP